MTDQTGSFASPDSAPPAQASTTDVARDQAANVGRSATEAGSRVAQTATEQARVVVAETTRQARDLLGEAGGQAREQAAAQQQKAASQLRTVADEMAQMADKGGQSGLATEVARQAADRMHGAASWLEKREPADLVQAVRDYARRRPGTFLVGAAIAGLAVGRLTRGLTAAAQSDPEPGLPQPERGPEPHRAIPPAGFASSPAGQGYLTEPPTVPDYPAAPVYPATSFPDPASIPGPLSGDTTTGTEYALPAEQLTDDGTGAEPLSRDDLDSSFEELDRGGASFPDKQYPQGAPESYRPAQP